MSICSLKSDNRNTAVRRPPCVKGAVTAGDWGIVSDGELDNLRILQQALNAPLGSLSQRRERDERIAKGGAFPLLVESTPLSWAVRSCFPGRAEGRAPYQEEKRRFSFWSLLGWCAILLFSALPVAHPGRQRPGEAAPPDLRPWWKERKLPAE